ncbi:MAG: DUF433 domain-containing protein [Planctomycetota bacterium]
MDRIEAREDIQAGKPVIRGTRLTVEFILDLLANGWSTDDVVDSYPGVEPDDVRACLVFARERLEEERVLPLQSIR